MLTALNHYLFRPHQSLAQRWAFLLIQLIIVAIPWSMAWAGYLALVGSIGGWTYWLLKRRELSYRISSNKSTKHPRMLYWWLVGLLTYTVLHALQISIHDDGWRKLEAPSRLLLLSGVCFLPMIVDLPLSAYRKAWSWAGCSFGLISLWMWSLHPGERVFGFYGFYNLFALAAMANALILTVLLVNDIDSSKLRRSFMVAGVIGSLIASVLSGTRASWVGFVLLMVALTPALYRFYKSQQNPRIYRWLMVVGLIVATVMISLPMLQRVHETQSDLQRIARGDLSDSIGMRVKMLQMSLEMIRQHPLIGNGLTAFNDQINQWADHLNYPEDAMQRGFQNPHNQFIYLFVTLGIPLGLWIIWVVLILPLKAAWVQTNDAAKSIRLVMILTLLFMLAEAILDRHQGAQWYTITVGLLLGWMTQATLPSIEQKRTE